MLNTSTGGAVMRTIAPLCFSNFKTKSQLVYSCQIVRHYQSFLGQAHSTASMTPCSKQNLFVRNRNNFSARTVPAVFFQSLRSLKSNTQSSGKSKQPVPQQNAPPESSKITVASLSVLKDVLSAKSKHLRAPSSELAIEHIISFKLAQNILTSHYLKKEGSLSTKKSAGEVLEVPLQAAEEYIAKSWSDLNLAGEAPKVESLLEPKFMSIAKAQDGTDVVKLKTFTYLSLLLDALSPVLGGDFFKAVSDSKDSKASSSPATSSPASPSPATSSPASSSPASVAATAAVAGREAAAAATVVGASAAIAAGALNASTVAKVKKAPAGAAPAVAASAATSDAAPAVKEVKNSSAPTAKLHVSEAQLRERLLALLPPAESLWHFAKLHIAERALEIAHNEGRSSFTAGDKDLTLTEAQCRHVLSSLPLGASPSLASVDEFSNVAHLMASDPFFRVIGKAGSPSRSVAISLRQIMAAPPEPAEVRPPAMRSANHAWSPLELSALLLGYAAPHIRQTAWFGATGADFHAQTKVLATRVQFASLPAVEQIRIQRSTIEALKKALKQTAQSFNNESSFSSSLGVGKNNATMTKEMESALAVASASAERVFRDLTAAAVAAAEQALPEGELPLLKRKYYARSLLELAAPGSATMAGASDRTKVSVTIPSAAEIAAAEEADVEKGGMAEGVVDDANSDDDVDLLTASPADSSLERAASATLAGTAAAAGKAGNTIQPDYKVVMLSAQGVAFDRMLAHLAAAPFLAMDCEMAGRHITLLQMCAPKIGSFAKTVYIVDLVYTTRRAPLRNAMMARLRPVLEDKDTIKILHSPYMDETFLRNEFQIQVYPLADTQAIFNVVQYAWASRAGITRKDLMSCSVGLKSLMELFGIVHEQKGNVKASYKSNPRIWATRPLPEEMVHYACQDVDFLGEMYRGLLREVSRLNPEFLKDPFLHCAVMSLEARKAAAAE